MAALSVFAVACNGNNLNQLPPSHTEVHYQGGEAPPVDVLWVVDDSGSMSQEQAKLAANFQSFIQYFENLNLDFHMAIVTTDTFASSESGKFMGTPAMLTSTTPNYAQAFQSNVNVGTSSSGIERGMEGARMGLCWALDPASQVYQDQCVAAGLSQFPNNNTGFLRPNAVLAVIMVSDEEDQSINIATTANPTNQTQADDPAWRAANLEPVSDFVNFFTAVKGGNSNLVNVSVIAGDVPNGCVSADANAKPGVRYNDLATALHGVKASICATDFGPILDQIGSEVAGSVTAFPTTYKPFVDTITVQVDGVTVPYRPSGPDGWFWNDAIGGVQFWPPSVPPQCAVITIDYQVQDFGGTVVTGNNENPPAVCSGTLEPVGSGSLDGGAFACTVGGRSDPASLAGLAALAGLAGLVFRRRRRV